jgi:AcrR family transcriptional regulator
LIAGKAGIDDLGKLQHEFKSPKDLDKQPPVLVDSEKWPDGLDTIQTCLYYSSMRPKRAAKSDAKQRILETADRLFYQDGIRAVGIDRIIAEAGVAKMTLYSHFPSKDYLILAVLKYREECVQEFFRSAMERHGKRMKNKLRAFFAALKDWFESPGFRGCAFQNAALELANPDHAGTQFVRDYKRRFAAVLRGFVQESVGNRAAKLAPAIALLVEGAIVTAVIHGTSEAAEVARNAAMKLVEEAKGA